MNSIRHSFNSCGGVCGALWTSVVFQQIPAWCLSQWWRREFVWWIGQNQWAPQFRSHQKDQFCCLALMTWCKALQDVNSQTLHEDSKDNNSLLILPGCCGVFVGDSEWNYNACWETREDIWSIFQHQSALTNT